MRISAEQVQHNNRVFDRLAAAWRAAEEMRRRMDQRSAPGYQAPPDQSAVIRRARAYLLKEPPAISGQRGHNRAYHVTCVLLLGFGLSREEAWPLLQEWNAACQPRWSDKELRHKLDDVDKKPGERGYLLRTERPAPPLPPELAEEDGDDAGEGVRREYLPGDFPLDCFPEAVRRFCAEVALAVGCPVDFPAVTCLMVAATALGNTRAVGVGRKWTEAARFYAAVVADPGAAKTPAVNLVCQPLYEMQRKFKQEHDQAFQGYERRLEQYRAEIEAYRAEAKKRYAEARSGALVPPEKPEPPVCRHLYTSDATTEFLAEALSQTPRGFALIRDELTGWVLGMNQYKGGKGSDRQFFLSAWSGEPAKVDRKSNVRGPVLVTHPFLNVFGSIQPDMLGELRDERGREDGFVHRILFSYPEPNPAPDRLGEVSEAAEAAWRNVVLKLLTVEMHKDETDGHLRPYVVKMDAGAKAEWDEWFRQHAAERRDERLPPALTGPWSKIVAYCARLVLVVHYLRWASGDRTIGGAGDAIDSVSVLYGTVLVEYFKSHCRKVYESLTCGAEDRKADAILRWVRQHDGKATPRLLIRNRVAGLRRRSEAIKALKDLEDRGFGRYYEEQDPQGRWPKCWFAMNPPRPQESVN